MDKEDFHWILRIFILAGSIMLFGLIVDRFERPRTEISTNNPVVEQCIDSTERVRESITGSQKSVGDIRSTLAEIKRLADEGLRERETARP